MTSFEHQNALLPFRPGDRSSGVLMHVTSLPSPYGVGDVGPAAFAWVDSSTMPARDGGRRCRWGLQDVATHHINRLRPSLEIHYL